ncbi:MAG: pitrilysin family protein [Bacteroidota bacterium]|nr:pitrilysin family protein [Bacteroidota bacterium]
MEYQVHTLKNGIRLLHKWIDSPVAHAGVMIHTGSRDEEEHEQGMAHFIEHVIFKGTQKRKAYHILCRMEDVGGDLNAYTAKEETCIYASFMKEYYDRSFELFSDIIFNSTFPEKELEKEKEVILDEINSYKDNPSELIFDDFEALIFDGHRLGTNILGTPKHLKTFNKQMALDFIKRAYFTDEMIVCSVGNIEFSKLVYYFEKYFSEAIPNLERSRRVTFQDYSANSKSLKMETHQSHCILGNVAYSIKDERRIGLHLLNNILAGPGMNSRLNLSLREKHGYAYNVESNYTPYSDTGIFQIYFGTDHNYLNKSLKIVKKEIKYLQEKKLGSLQLSKAKKQLIGQLAIGNENHVNQMMSLGKSYLVFGQSETLEETSRKIEIVTAEELRDMANEILELDQLSVLIYLSKNGG